MTDGQHNKRTQQQQQKRQRPPSPPVGKEKMKKMPLDPSHTRAHVRAVLALAIIGAWPSDSFRPRYLASPGVFFVPSLSSFLGGGGALVPQAIKCAELYVRAWPDFFVSLLCLVWRC